MIKEEIQKAIPIALKEGRRLELSALRFLLSIIYYEEIARQRKLKDDEIIVLLQREVRKRREAIELFKKGKRDDLVAEEEKQIIVIEQYLPKKLSAEELNEIIDEMIASSKEINTGKIIGLVMTKVKSRADGATVATLVREKLLSPSKS